MAKTRTRDNASYEEFAWYIEESGLLFEMRSICLHHHVTVRDIYLDARGPTVHAARLEVWWWLSRILKKSFSEIGTLFHRDPTSVAYAVRKLEAHAVAMGVPLDSVSHVRDVARSLVALVSERIVRTARDTALAIHNEKKKK